MDAIVATERISKVEAGQILTRISLFLELACPPFYKSEKNTSNFHFAVIGFTPDPDAPYRLGLLEPYSCILFWRSFRFEISMDI